MLDIKETTLDDFDDLIADPIGWIVSNIRDDISGIEWVLDDMNVVELLEPALEAYIIPSFEKAGVPVPDRNVLIEHVSQLVSQMTKFEA